MCVSAPSFRGTCARTRGLLGRRQMVAWAEAEGKLGAVVVACDDPRQVQNKMRRDWGRFLPRFRPRYFASLWQTSGSTAAAATVCECLKSFRVCFALATLAPPQRFRPCFLRSSRRWTNRVTQTDRVEPFLSFEIPLTPLSLHRRCPFLSGHEGGKDLSEPLPAAR